MKLINLILISGLIIVGAVSCKSKSDNAVDNAVNEGAEAAADASQEVGEGLSEDEAKALLREEQVSAGTGISKDDVEIELGRLEEEIQAEIEGRDPDFSAKPSANIDKPIVAKETFSPEKASSETDYERDMRVMEMIRTYIKQKEDTAKPAASAEAAPAATEAAPTAAK